MDEFNPYSAPKAELTTPYTGEGVWRDGDLLVMTKEALLPDRCVKCNVPCGGWRIKRNLMWHPSFYYLIVLFNILIYIVVAMIVRYTAKVMVPLCPLHRKRRRRAIAIGWLLVILGIVGMIMVIPLVPDYPGWAVLGGVILILGGIFYGVLGSQVVHVKKIDKVYVWLRKVSPEFLAELPPWPFPTVP